MDTLLNQLPSDFIRRLNQLIPEKDMPTVIEGLTLPRKTTFRVNTLKTDAVTLATALSNKGVSLTPVPWYPDAFIVENIPLRTLTELPEYADGLFYVQSLSSMIPPLVLDPKPGEKVLDIAAAPGSKTTQMAALMGNTGELVANDTSQVRIYRLIANLKMQGVTNVTMSKADGRSLWMTYPEYFDKTLVDTPCSMDGRFTVTDPKSYEDWSLKKVRDLALLQRFLLRSAISATKKGGTIVYSTCTLSPEENEEILEWVMNKDQNVVSVESIDMPNLPAARPLTSWAGKTFSPKIGHALRIYPSETMEGFFIVKLLKRKSSVPRILVSGKSAIIHTAATSSRHKFTHGFKQSFNKSKRKQ